MRDANNDSYNIRDTWLNFDHSSDAVVNPEDVGENNDPNSEDYNPTKIAAAYLYWTAWKSKDALTTIFEDTCDDFDEWNVTYQTRVPTSDGDTAGTWNTAPCWDDVDETTPVDTNYMTGSGGGGSADTGWLNPTANAAPPGGDGNGFESNPTNAYGDGNGNASTIITVPVTRRFSSFLRLQYPAFLMRP